MIIGSNIVLHTLKWLKKVDFKCSHSKQRKVYDMIEVLVTLRWIMMLYHMRVSNQPQIYTLCQLLINNIEKERKANTVKNVKRDPISLG